MKKRIKKLVLNRETLRSLEGEGLNGVLAGLSQQQCSAPSYCVACITLLASVCPQRC